MQEGDGEPVQQGGMAHVAQGALVHMRPFPGTHAPIPSRRPCCIPATSSKIAARQHQQEAAPHLEVHQQHGHQLLRRELGGLVQVGDLQATNSTAATQHRFDAALGVWPTSNRHSVALRGSSLTTCGAKNTTNYRRPGMRNSGQVVLQPVGATPLRCTHVVHALAVGAGRHLKGEVLQVLLDLRQAGRHRERWVPHCSYSLGFVQFGWSSSSNSSRCVMAADWPRMGWERERPLQDRRSVAEQGCLTCGSLNFLPISRFSWLTVLRGLVDMLPTAH